MKRDDKTRRTVNAKVKMLEAETELLSDAIEEALHWDRPHEVKRHLQRLQCLTKALAGLLDLGDLEGK